MKPSTFPATALLLLAVGIPGCHGAGSEPEGLGAEGSPRQAAAAGVSSANCSEASYTYSGNLRFTDYSISGGLAYYSSCGGGFYAADSSYTVDASLFVRGEIEMTVVITRENGEVETHVRTAADASPNSETETGVTRTFRTEGVSADCQIIGGTYIVPGSCPARVEISSRHHFYTIESSSSPYTKTASLLME